MIYCNKSLLRCTRIFTLLFVFFVACKEETKIDSKSQFNPGKHKLNLFSNEGRFILAFDSQILFSNFRYSFIKRKSSVKLEGTYAIKDYDSFFLVEEDGEAESKYSKVDQSKIITECDSISFAYMRYYSDHKKSILKPLYNITIDFVNYEIHNNVSGLSIKADSIDMDLLYLFVTHYNVNEKYIEKGIMSYQDSMFKSCIFRIYENNKHTVYCYNYSSNDDISLKVLDGVVFYLLRKYDICLIEYKSCDHNSDIEEKEIKKNIQYD